jgi:hypothetical protein
MAGPNDKSARAGVARSGRAAAGALFAVAS